MRMVVGQVTVSSGQIAVVDAGLMRGWQGHEHVQEAVAATAGAAAMFDYGGPNAAIVPGIPNGTLQILGTRTPQQHWRFLDLVCDGDGVVARADEVGGLIVDEARVMVADLTALGAWQHDESMDGKADVAFWGRDADEIAARNGAGKLPEGVWGWADLTVADAEQRFQSLMDEKDRGAKFMPDYRPHSHHYAAMAQVRASPFEVGHVQADGQTCFVAMTSWGDGIYPVLALRDAAGRVVGVRINLGREEGPEVAAIGQKLGAQAGLPPDPMSSARTAMAGAAADVAQSTVRRAIVGQIKQYLPRPLWPMIPGERGDVSDNLASLGKKKAWAVVSGCIVSALFLVFFVVAFAAVGVIVLYAVMTSR